MALHTILGAGGAISNELVPILRAENLPVRLVSRHVPAVEGVESMVADLTDLESTKRAVKGSSVAYLLAGLKYDHQVWAEQWPEIMTNVIEACKESSAKLIFFDNVYMYGMVQGPMTEDSLFRPISKKGEIRARIAEQLLNEMSTGKLEALIARSADFYGPGGDKSSVPNLLVFARLAKGQKAQWLCSADVEHSLTYIPDAARGVYMLGQEADAIGQTWHLPTARNPLTGRQFISAASEAMGRPYGVAVLPKWMMSLGGLFDSNVKESIEMAYQSEYQYLFDSTKFTSAFEFEPTSYLDGIKHTADQYKKA